MATSVVDKERFSRLHWACYRGEEAAVKQLLVAGDALLSALEDSDNESEATPLMWAAMSGNVQVVELLLNAGADCNAKDIFGQSSVMHAVQNSRLVVTHVLIERGANIFVRDKDEHSLLHWAAFKNDSRMCTYLLNRNLSLEDRDIIGGATPLHWAAIRGNGSVVALLLERGADRLAIDGNGKTALELASDGAHRWAMEELQSNDSGLIKESPIFWWVGFLAPILFWTLFVELIHWSFVFLIIPIGYLGLRRGLIATHVAGHRGVRSGGPFGFMFSTFFGVMFYYWFRLWPALGNQGTPFLAFEAGMMIVMILLYFTKQDPGMMEKNNLGGQIVDWSTNSILCPYCMSHAPERSYHSRRGNICIARFDHFCPWLDTPIGLKNQKWFWALVFWTFLMHLVWLWNAWIFIIDQNVGIEADPAFSSFVVLQIGQAAFTLVLTLSQTRSVLLDETTHERRGHRPRLFDRGIKLNIRQFFGLAGKEQRDYSQ